MKKLILTLAFVAGCAHAQNPYDRCMDRADDYMVTCIDSFADYCSEAEETRSCLYGIEKCVDTYSFMANRCKKRNK